MKKGNLVMRNEEFYAKIELLLKAIIEIRDSKIHELEDYEAIDFMYIYAISILKE